MISTFWKKLQILTLTVFIVTALNAQITEQELIGTWKVVRIFADSTQFGGESLSSFKNFTDALLKSTYTFEANHSARVNMAMEDIDVPKGYWKFDAAKAMIDIVEWEERNERNPASLLGILVVRKDQRFVFALQETPYAVLVEELNSRSTPVPVKPKAKN